MTGSLRQLARMGALMLGLTLLVPGCSTSSPTESGKSPRYRPDVSDRDTSTWTSSRNSDGELTTDPTGTGVDGRDSEHIASQTAPVLRRGDEVLVLLKDIPKEDDFSETVDDRGCIKFPLLGNVKVETKTTADAERMVELAYIRLGYYKKINVVIRKQDDRFYIMGEVKREGQYPISGDVSLSQALALAAGFTDFADQTEVQINRGEKVLTFNMKKIRKQESADPPIIADDKIYVPRKVF